MFERAREFAKNGRTDQAVAMLNRVLKVYKGTAAARESKAALDRAEKKLPLFSDRPLVLAQNEEPQPAPIPDSPPVVVNASPAQPQAAEGQAALVLPANPPEVVQWALHPLRRPELERPWPRPVAGRSSAGSGPISTPVFMSPGGRW